MKVQLSSFIKLIIFTSLLLALTAIPVFGSTSSHLQTHPQSLATPLTLDGVTTRVSVGNGCVQANADSSYYETPSISGDGRYIAFSSSADNLVARDLNGVRDVFVHDRQSGSTQMISLTSESRQGNSDSTSPAISSDGRYVAFKSYASNLVQHDDNGVVDIFLHDLQTGITSLVSKGMDDEPSNCSSGSPAISADGRYVAFQSCASNLVPGDLNAQWDIFVYDTQTGTMELVSISSSQEQGQGESAEPAISANGRYVAFQSAADNLVPDDTNNTYDVFVHDRLNGTTQRVSIASDGSQGNDLSGLPSISSDGTLIAFHSSANNLVPGDVNNAWDIFVHDTTSGLTELISQSSTGVQGNSGSSVASISDDGNWVAFKSQANNLSPDDTDNLYDIFLRDRLSGETTLISAASNSGATKQDSEDPTVNGDGTFVAFWSLATNLVPDDTNGFVDVFLRDTSGGEGNYSISGKVLDEGDNPMENVLVWTGACLTATTNASGEYVITGAYTDTYTLQPALAGFAFDPNSRTVSIPPDAVDQDFTALPTYTVYGKVLDEDGHPLWDVRVCSDTGLCAFTDINGEYTLGGLINGTYTLTADLPGYAFEPENRTISVPPDVLGQDFTGKRLYTASGTVTDWNGNPLSGVTITPCSGEEILTCFIDLSTTTDSNGAFTLEGLISDDYIIIPDLSTHFFTPSTRTISVPPDAENVDFTGVDVSLMLFLPMVGR